MIRELILHLVLVHLFQRHRVQRHYQPSYDYRELQRRQFG